MTATPLPPVTADTPPHTTEPSPTVVPPTSTASPNQPGGEVNNGETEWTFAAVFLLGGLGVVSLWAVWHYLLNHRSP